MGFLSACRRRLQRFVGDDRATITMEFMIMAPMLFWAYLSTQVFFDGYRMSTLGQKAAYTVGDVLSRETQAITPEYIDTLYNLALLMSNNRNENAMRVTAIQWDGDNDEPTLLWSHVRGSGSVQRGSSSMAPLTQGNMPALSSQLPSMADHEPLIIVEIWIDWNPFISIGITTLPIDAFIFTRPRYGLPLHFNS